MIRDHLHRAVGERHRLRRVERQIEVEQRILPAHEAEADRTVAQVRRARLGRRIEVDVDDVVEHPHRQRHGVAQRRLVEASVDDVARQVDRSEIADRRLLGAGVERDLGAQVRAVDDAGVVLRRADVARILERDPRMPGLEEHRQHLAPQRGRRDGAVQVQLAARGARLRLAVALGEGPPVDLVQIGHLVRREQRPRPVGLDPGHEQVGDPHRRVHVVGAAALVAGVAAQLEEVLDVVVPGLEIGAGRAAALAAAVDRHRHVVGDLEERHHALALDAGAGDARAGAADAGPVVAEPARPLRELGVVAERLEDVGEIVLHRGQVAGRQLRPRRAGVEQRRRRRHVAQRRHEVVEGDRPGGRLVLVDGEPHGDAHPERLRQLHRAAVVAGEVAIGERLHAEVLQQGIALRPQRRGERRVVERGQARIVEAAADAAPQPGRERVAVARVAIAVAGRAPASPRGTAHRAAAATPRRCRRDRAR